MARQFVFKDDNIISLDKAYLNDMLCLDNTRKNEENGLEELYKLIGDEFKHIRVLRHKVDDQITVNNMVCKIVYITKDFAIVNKLGNASEKGKPNTNITLYPAYLKSDKMDYLVQKSVELGVSNVSPFFSKNTIVKLDSKDRIKRREKLQRICTESAKQCGRTDQVSIAEFMDFEDMLYHITKHQFCIFAYENEVRHVKSVINNLKEQNKIYKDIAIIVGPEGGFDIKEVDRLNQINNVHSVSLGERILRAETASINLLTILMYEFD